MRHMMAFTGILFTVAGFVLIPTLMSMFPAGDLTGLFASFGLLIIGIIMLIASFRGND